MGKVFAAAVIALILANGAALKAEDIEEKHSKHHKISELIGVLSSDSRQKLKMAKEEALKDPAVAAAKARRDQAEAEYRELLHRQMLKADPSLEPILQKITELRAHSDY